jgi:SynChlorMet cassette radical SAM/SPASM protein ScmE
MKVLSAPERVTLNLTNQCNLLCRYCAVSSTKNAPGDLSSENWISIIDELAQIKVFQLVISGGEPFLRQDLLAIIKHIARHSFRLAINTNATLIQENIAAYLRDYNRLNYIQVSLDGPDAASHDRIRGKGSFKRLVTGIKMLSHYDIPFYFFVVVHQKNHKHIEDIIQFAYDTGAYQVAFSPIVPQGSALKHLKDLWLSFEEGKAVEAELRRLKRLHPDLVGGTLMQGIEWMDEISEIAAEEEFDRESNYISSCGGSISECAIRPDGEVIPCDRLWEYGVGNMREESFQNIWLHGEGFKKFRQRYQRRIDSFSECRNCRYTGVCRGGCPATAFGLGKGVEGWDPLSCYQVFRGHKKNTIFSSRYYEAASNAWNRP